MEPTPVNIACHHCLATNRVPTARLADDPVCGRCGKDLLDGRPLNLGDADFDRVTRRTDLPVLVDFWAPWCGPCVGMAPHFEQAARLLKGRALLVKVDSDANPQTAGRFAIRSLPTLVLLHAGVEQSRQSGAVQASQIISLIR